MLLTERMYSYSRACSEGTSARRRHSPSSAEECLTRPLLETRAQKLASQLGVIATSKNSRLGRKAQNLMKGISRSKVPKTQGNARIQLGDMLIVCLTGIGHALRYQGTKGNARLQLGDMFAVCLPAIAHAPRYQETKGNARLQLGDMFIVCLTGIGHAPRYREQKEMPGSN